MLKRAEMGRIHGEDTNKDPKGSTCRAWNGRKLKVRSKVEIPLKYVTPDLVTDDCRRFGDPGRLIQNDSFLLLFSPF